MTASTRWPHPIYTGCFHPRNLLILATLVLGAALAGCAIGPERELLVPASTVGNQYIPRQVQSFLGDMGYVRQQFRDYDTGTLVRQKRNADEDLMMFQAIEEPSLQVRVRFDRRQGEVRMTFLERGSTKVGPKMEVEYKRLRDELAVRLGSERVIELGDL